MLDIRDARQQFIGEFMIPNRIDFPPNEKDFFEFLPKFLIYPKLPKYSSVIITQILVDSKA